MDTKEGLELRERDVTPTREVLEQVLKDSYIAYETLQDALPGLEIEQDWIWYTPHKAWYAKGLYFWTSARGTRKEKVLYWIYFYEGYFNLAVWFKEKNRDEILKANVSEKTKEMIRDAKTVMGQPTFPALFKVTSTEILNYIYTLIDCKKRLEGK